MKSSEFEGCRDHACLIQKPKQGTNGGRCLCGSGKVGAYINCLRDELALSQKREGILRVGLEEIVSLETPDHTKGACTYIPVELSEREIGIDLGHEAAADIARDTFKAAEEVK